MPNLIQVILVIVAIGLIVWLCTFLPLPAPFPTIILIVGLIAVILYLLRAFGVWTGGGPAV